MARVTTLTLVLLLSSLSFAQATQSPRMDHTGLARTFPHESQAAADQKQEFVITEKTEVKLDGRNCHYTEIPESAAVILLEVASDKKEILKIHFRTK